MGASPVVFSVKHALAVVYGVPQDTAGRSRLLDRDSLLHETAFKGRSKGLEAHAAKCSLLGLRWVSQTPFLMPGRPYPSAPVAPSCQPWSPAFACISRSFFCPFSSSPRRIFPTTRPTFAISSSSTISLFLGGSLAGRAVLRHHRCRTTASLPSDLTRHLKCPPAWTDGGAIRPMSLAF